MDKKPTKDMIRRTLQASQTVWLAKGYSSARKTVYVNNYTMEHPDSIHFPEFGNWKSFVKIKNELRNAIDKEFPIVAFPYRVIEDEITLWQRNPNDIDYTKEIGTFKVNGEEVRKEFVYECKHVEYEYDGFEKYVLCHNKNCESQTCDCQRIYSQQFCPFYEKGKSRGKLVITDSDIEDAKRFANTIMKGRLNNDQTR